MADTKDLSAEVARRTCKEVNIMQIEHRYWSCKHAVDFGP